MTVYRLRSFGPTGRIVAVQQLSAADDKEAVAASRARQALRSICGKASGAFTVQRPRQKESPAGEGGAKTLAAYCAGTLPGDGAVCGVICGTFCGAVDGRSLVTSSAAGPPMAMSGMPTILSPTVSRVAIPVPPYPTRAPLAPAANPTLGLATRNETANTTSLLFIIYHSCHIHFKSGPDASFLNEELGAGGSKKKPRQ